MGPFANGPKNNPFCMMLHNLSGKKDENKEETYAGKDWKFLQQDQLAACVGENGGFMNENPYKRITNILPIQTYDTTTDYTYPFGDLIFEHDIRTNLKKSKGFLLPYHEYMSLDEE